MVITGKQRRRQLQLTILKCGHAFLGMSHTQSRSHRLLQNDTKPQHLKQSRTTSYLLPHHLHIFE